MCATVDGQDVALGASTQDVEILRAYVGSMKLQQKAMRKRIGGSGADITIGGKKGGNAAQAQHFFEQMEEYFANWNAGGSVYEPVLVKKRKG